MTIKPWSYSKLSDYEKCAHAHMYRRIVKLEEPPSYHMNIGNAVHSMAEKFLLDEIKVLPPVLNKFAKEFKSLKAAKAIAEEPMSLDRNWLIIPNGWNDKNTWLRLKIDARVDNYIIDFKTGKIYDSHVEQARLYANVYMMNSKDCDCVEVEFWYLNLGEVVSFMFYRENLEEHIADWERRVAIMDNDTTFAPTPHEYCRNCYVNKYCQSYS